MKKNIIKLSILIIMMVAISTTTVVFAVGTWTREVSVSTPNFGGVTYNNSIRNSKQTRSTRGSIYATYQKTALAHSVALTYNNIYGNKVIGSDWTSMQVDTIKRPYLKTTNLYLAFWSAAKSNNLEPTSGTIVKYKFSADEL